ncbi:MAG: radical SAM protein [Elusimicrobiota bacterium]
MSKKVYSTLKLFRYPEQLKALEERRVAAPVHIRIKPENACNHDCWFCAYRVGNLQLGEDMSEKDRIPKEKFFEIIRDIIDMKVEAVTFSGGGEPLIYKHIVDGINMLGAADVRVATLTNGAFLKGKTADAFAKYGTWVRVSMDYWDGPSLAKSRHVKETEFDQVIGNMRGFAARDTKCTLGVSYIVSKESHLHIYEFCKLMKEIGVRHVKLAGVVIANDGKENNRYHAEFKSEVERQIAKAKALNTSTNGARGFEIVNHYHETAERFDKAYTICPYLQFLTVIGADCKVYTCQDKAYTDGGTLGSIKDRSFKEFWFSKKNQEKVYALNPNKDCNHHCVTHTKNLLLMDYLGLDKDHAKFV